MPWHNQSRCFVPIWDPRRLSENRGIWNCDLIYLNSYLDHSIFRTCFQCKMCTDSFFNFNCLFILLQFKQLIEIIKYNSSHWIYFLRWNSGPLLRFDISAVDRIDDPSTSESGISLRTASSLAIDVMIDHELTV